MSCSLKDYQIIEEKLKAIYGKKRSKGALSKIVKIIEKYSEKINSSHISKSKQKEFFDERDIVLITYGDTIIHEKKKPLDILYQFITKYLDPCFNIIHLLPCYPYSSDDGFSVIDYQEINPDLGTWKHIEKFATKYDLVMDFIANHISSRSHWFKEFLQGNPRYKNFFISLPKDSNTSSIIRARTHPLLTKFNQKGKEIYIWTTFSPDQVDLNYSNEDLLTKMIDILLYYCSNKVKIIRLDAIGHIWKKPGTGCLNLKEVHLIIQLMRAVLDRVFPVVLLLTEANVPQKENLSYFGNGYNEAQIIYQFALPILVLHTFYTENTICLLNWIKRMKNCSKQTTFLNVLGTHDGIGVVPVTNILSRDQVNHIADQVKERGGFISYKARKDGSTIPYELNISYYSAISNPGGSVELNCKKYISSQVIMLSLAGIPGIYIHSLFGTENDLEEVKKTGQKRKINRKKYFYNQLAKKLSDSSSKEYRIYQDYLKIIKKRKYEKSFHPNGKQEAIFLKKSIFSIIRTSPDNKEKIIVLLNVTARKQFIPVSRAWHVPVNEKYYDIISEKVISINGSFQLGPYQFVWLKKAQ